MQCPNKFEKQWDAILQYAKKNPLTYIERFMESKGSQDQREQAYTLAPSCTPNLCGTWHRKGYKINRRALDYIGVIFTPQEINDFEIACFTGTLIHFIFFAII